MSSTELRLRTDGGTPSRRYVTRDYHADLTTDQPVVHYRFGGLGVAWASGTAFRHVLVDHLGSPHAEVVYGTAEGQRRYFPFGADRALAGQPNLVAEGRYTGQRRADDGAGIPAGSCLPTGRCCLPGVGLFRRRPVRCSRPPRRRHRPSPRRSRPRLQASLPSLRTTAAPAARQTLAAPVPARDPPLADTLPPPEGEAVMESRDKPVRYVLEVYRDGDDPRVVAAWFNAAMPFMGFAAGQILNPRWWSDRGTPGTVLRILNVEHLVNDLGDHHTHHVMLFAEEVDDTLALRRVPTWRMVRRGPPAG